MSSKGELDVDVEFTESVQVFFRHSRDIVAVCRPRFTFAAALVALASSALLALPSACFFFSSPFFLASSSWILSYPLSPFFIPSFNLLFLLFLLFVEQGQNLVASTLAPVFTHKVLDLLLVINPLRMRSRFTVVCLSVCVCVCLLPFYLLHCWVILHKCLTTWINLMSAKFLTRGFC